ncbi:unnamed protein product [Brachionus calyciflorus]|uniref:Deoxyribonuclease n=1 Tax=Brachionus calyciflorus TaxID=104777 RepID=A0A814G5U5_9BILA|nr:unnamed protein product [Brachionus calyciflorus]
MFKLSFVIIGLYLISSSLGFLLQEPKLKIGSFNIQAFGQDKIGTPENVETIIKIMSRYDILAIQEVRDSTNEHVILNFVLNKLNEMLAGTGIKYNFIITGPLGASSYKENYAYIYRETTDVSSRKIEVVKHFVYDDVENVYGRPPFIAEFRILDSQLSIKEFTLMNLHIRPSYVFSETSAFRTVVDRYQNGVEKNIAIMGDLNFDCSFISGIKRNQVRSIISDFTWYINDDAATTKSTSGCAYDRILINSQKFNNAVVKGSNITYYYYLDLGLTTTQAAEISDHFPVEIDIN